jgi:hypothetical protein
MKTTTSDQDCCDSTVLHRVTCFLLACTWDRPGNVRGKKIEVSTSFRTWQIKKKLCAYVNVAT